MHSQSLITFDLRFIGDPRWIKGKDGLETSKVQVSSLRCHNKSV